MLISKFKYLRTLLVIAFGFIIYTNPASAATHLVTNADDSGAGSFRQAFLDAALPQNQGQINYIEFEPVFFATPRTITLSSFIAISGLPEIVVNGAGKNLLTITGGSDGITLHQIDGILTLKKLGFRNFARVGSNGGNFFMDEVIFDGATNGNADLLIFNGTQNVDINRSEFINSPLAFGRVISVDFLTGTFTLRNSTVANNQCTGINSSPYLNSPMVINVINSTISNNQRGGIDVSPAPGAASITVNVINSTIVRNSWVLTGSGIRNDTTFVTSTVNLRNTIVADNTRIVDGSLSDITGPVVSQGNNLIRALVDATVTGNTASNIMGVSPLLAATLDFNGGTTRNYALLPASPAIDAGNNCVVTDTCLSALSEDFLTPLLTDQRGVNRQIGSNVDIGAFEYLPVLAAEVSVAGRITNESGNGIARVRVSLTKPSGEIVFSLTNAFGYYRFDNIEVGQNFLLQANHKRYQFQNNPRLISVSEDVQNEDFTVSEIK